MQISVCPGCAGRVEESWSYCKTCGVRIPGHVAPNPPPRFLDLDNKLSTDYPCANVRTVHSTERRGRLSVRRALSEVVRHQFQQRRTKSILQERLLIDLERGNAAARRATIIKTERELRGAIHQDHGSVAPRWSSSSMLARGLDKLQPLRSKNRIAPPEEGRSSFRNNHRGEPKTIAKIAAASENILKTQQQETQARRKVATSAAKSKAWFWGPGNRTSNSEGDITLASPRTRGQGEMGIFWGAAPQAAVDAPAAESSSADSSTKVLELLQQDGQLKKSALLGGHNTGTFIPLLPAKAAVRSASNQTAEVARLAGEEYRAAPRDECVAKAKSAVRAARSAVSCTNERLFELELMVETNPAEGAENERGQGTESGETRHGDHKAIFASSVSSQITQLAVQLQLSQCLLATSIAAEARMMARFAREDAAATLLQAHLRGLFARSRSHRSKQLTKGKTTVADWSQDTSIIASIPNHDRRRAPLKNTAPANVGESEKAQPPDAEPPRKEGGWWAPAEPESADDVGKTEVELLKAVVKLQVIVRSRIARLRTRSKHFAKGKTSVADWSQDTSIIASIPNHERPRAPLKNTAPANVGGCEKAQPPDAEPLRKEGGWWAPAEPDSADDVGKTEMELLKAVVKFQAIVRSRIARLRNIASVNERFVEYFDDEYQHPFYVCKENNTSQWNRPFGFDGSLGHSPVLTTPANVGGCEKVRSPDAEPLRKEGGWWAPAEPESADDVGETEMELLKAVVKLQAIVRSRIARLRNIASVNERFIEYFDDEYQHPFYVCKETNTSQWNRPFGFDGSLGHSPVLTTASKGGVDGGNRAPKRVKVEMERGLCEADEQNASVNERFVEYFDEEYQHPFYVCKETNTSQWNRPFGFDGSLGHSSVLTIASKGGVDGGNRATERVKVEVERGLREFDEQNGVTVII